MFYNESINDGVIQSIQAASKTCDLLVVMGTSFSTQPMTGLLRWFDHCDVVVLNQTSVNLPNRPVDRLSLQVLGSFRTIFEEAEKDSEEGLDDLNGKWIAVLSVALRIGSNRNRTAFCKNASMLGNGLSWSALFVVIQSILWLLICFYCLNRILNVCNVSKTKKSIFFLFFRFLMPRKAKKSNVRDDR